MGPLSNPLFHFIDLMEKLRIPHALVGGMAVTLLARERFTRDVDFTVILSESQANRLSDIFKKDPAYRVDQISFVSSKRIPDLLRIIWKGTAVDLMVANTDFQKILVKRARKLDCEGRLIRVASFEDMIILKLLADRPRDREDIQALLSSHKDLDGRYIKKWAKVWEIEERLKNLKI